MTILAPVLEQFAAKHGDGAVTDLSINAITALLVDKGIATEDEIHLAILKELKKWPDTNTLEPSDTETTGGGDK